MKNKESKELEVEVMAHRYLYYVECENILSDAEYDILERKARVVCSSDSPVHAIGSSLPTSYTSEQIAKAKALQNKN